MTASPTASPQAIPSPSPSPTLAPTPSPAAVVRTELGGLLRSLVAAWSPTGETLIVAQPGGIDGTVLTAVSVAVGSGGVPLVAFGQSSGWDVRHDGSAFAISLVTGVGSARLATWDPRTGIARWITPDEPGVIHITPVWSSDGSAVYYSALRPPEDLGIFRVGATGTSQPTRIRAPEANGADLVGLTPDTRGLLWSRVQAGGSIEILDLTIGRSTSFDPTVTASVSSWRTTQPRALVITGACCAGRGRGTLVLWDDQAGTKRALFGSDLNSDDGVVDAAWDPSGTRIVAIVHDLAIPSFETAGPLMLMNEDGGARSSIPGTEGAWGVRWLRAGIVYVKGTDAGGGDIFLIPPSGGTPIPVFRVSYLGAWRVVAP